MNDSIKKAFNLLFRTVLICTAAASVMMVVSFIKTAVFVTERDGHIADNDMGVFVDGYHYEIGGVEYEAIAVCGENNFKTIWTAYKPQIEESYNNFIKKVTK